MAVPSSGELKLWDDLWNQELGGSQGENSLHSASVYAGFSTPDALSDFYGWSDVEIPTVSSNSATSVSWGSMTANGNVSSTGNENPDRGFYFGTSNNYASNTKYSVGTGGTGNFSRSMTGLSQSTTYKYFAYACNSAGEAVGSRIDQATTVRPYSATFYAYEQHTIQGANVGGAVYWINPYGGSNNHLASMTGGDSLKYTGEVQSANNARNRATGGGITMGFSTLTGTAYRSGQFCCMNGGASGFGSRTSLGVPQMARTTYTLGGEYAYQCNFGHTAFFCYGSDLKFKKNIKFL